MSANVYIGEFADGEERVAYAVEAASYHEAMAWLTREALADSIYPMHCCDRFDASAWLSSRAAKDQMVTGNIPEAEEIERLRVDNSWDRFYQGVQSDPKLLHEWISASPPTDETDPIAPVMAGRSSKPVARATSGAKS